MEEDYSWVAWLVIVAINWGCYSFFSKDEVKESSTQIESSYVNRRVIDSEDGYTWAENNDASSFDECQDQFGTGYDEDECNRYVKENYSGFSTFGGYECTEDCGGHDAGYEWAQENDISDDYDCDGNSNSFNEGCTAYVEKNY